jgi:hypothetical protein
VKGGDDGTSLVGLLAALVLVGLLAAGTGLGLGILPSTSTGAPPIPSTGSVGARSPAPLLPIETSLTSACQADAASVGMAQQAFRALSATGAFAGTSATAGGVTLLISGRYLRSSPGNATRYTIDTGTNGAVNVTNFKSRAATANFEANPSICDGV